MGRMTTEHTIPYMWVSSAGYDFKPNMSVYDNEQGYTKEQIFVAFLKNEQGLVLQGGATRITERLLMYTGHTYTYKTRRIWNFLTL